MFLYWIFSSTRAMWLNHIRIRMQRSWYTASAVRQLFPSLIHLPTSFFISRLLRGRWLTFLKAGGTMKWPLQITRTYSQSLMLLFLRRYLAQTPYVLHLQNFWLIRTVWMRKSSRSTCSHSKNSDYWPAGRLPAFNCSCL